MRVGTAVLLLGSFDGFVGVMNVPNLHSRVEVPSQVVVICSIFAQCRYEILRASMRVVARLSVSLFIEQSKVLAT